MQTIFNDGPSRFLLICWIGLACLSTSLAHAANFPERTVRIVVAYPPGGSTDTQARVLAQKLGERWNQQVLVENKPGGNTVIATSAVASAAPDGYTLLMTAMPFALNPLVMDSLPYDTQKDLAPVTLLTTVPSVFVVHPSLGVRNVQEFVTKYKQSSQTRPLPFASTGLLAFTHLGGELFSSESGVKLEHIPYKGSAAAHQDLLAGRVSLMFDNGALQHIQAGKLVPLGVTSLKRMPLLPEVPTLAEQGFPGFDAVAWFGIFTRGGTPKPIIDQLAADITWAIQSPDVVQKLSVGGIVPSGGTPEEFQTYLDSEVKRWGEIIASRNIELR